MVLICTAITRTQHKVLSTKQWDMWNTGPYHPLQSTNFRIASFGMYNHAHLSHSLCQTPLAALKCRVFLINPGFFRSREETIRNNLAFWVNFICSYQVGTHVHPLRSFVINIWCCEEQCHIAAHGCSRASRGRRFSQNISPRYELVVSRGKKNIVSHAWGPYGHIHMVACLHPILLQLSRWSNRNCTIFAPAFGPDPPNTEIIKGSQRHQARIGTTSRQKRFSRNGGCQVSDSRNSKATKASCRSMPPKGSNFNWVQSVQ